MHQARVYCFDEDFACVSLAHVEQLDDARSNWWSIRTLGGRCASDGDAIRRGRHRPCRVDTASGNHCETGAKLEIDVACVREHSVVRARVVGKVPRDHRSKTIRIRW